MSISLIPGYDFAITEVVTKDRLSAWVGGIYNATGEPTATDLGLVFPDITIVASMTTAVSEGMLALDTTTGMLSINTRWGYTPLAGTKGAMFTRRIKHSLERVNAVSKVWFNAWEVGLSYDITVAAVFPVSSYSAGLHRVGYAGDLYGLTVSSSGAAVAYGYMRGGVLWPTAERPMVAQTFGTSATLYRPMVAFGGWTPLLATCVTNGYTAAYMHPTTMGAVQIHGGAYTVITRDPYIKFSVGARNGEALGPTPGSYQFGYHYPVWSDAKETHSPRYF